MASSQEKTHEEEGFETWLTPKKIRRKTVAQQTFVECDSGSKNVGEGADHRVPLCPEPVSRKKRVRTTKQDDAATRRGNNATRKANEEGTVVITEKEYLLLLSMKRKSKESHCVELDDDGGIADKQACAEESQGSMKSKHVPSHVNIDDVGQKRGDLLVLDSFPPREVDDEEEKWRLENSKKRTQSGMSPVVETADENEDWRQRQRMKAQSVDVEFEQRCDSNSQKNSKGRLASARIPGGPSEKSGQSLGRRLEKGKATEHVEKRSAFGGSNVRQVMDDEVDHRKGHKLVAWPSVRFGEPLHNKSAQKSSPERRVALAKKTSFFPFQDSEGNDDLPGRRGVGNSFCGGESNGDDDFQDPPAHECSSCELEERRVLLESEARAKRKRKKAERERSVRKREAAGEKPYYIMVSGSGTPYGDGLTTWKAELNKLCRALDPSIRDVRHQPHQKIQILKKRLTDNYDYSGIISDKYLIPLIGQQVSARRNELMNNIRDGRGRPTGVSEDAWDKLVSVCSSPNFQRKSSAMKYANFCRRSLGRTRPGGEIGVREKLKSMLERSPDPDEVQDEMTRDKGYGGKKMKRKAVSAMPTRLSFEYDEEDIEQNCLSRQNLHSEDMASPSYENEVKSCREGVTQTAAQQMELMQKMQAEIEGLKALMQATVP